MPRRIILPTLLVLSIAAQLSAQTPTQFRISGKAVNSLTGQALAGVEVSIGKAEQFDSTVQKLLTGDDGEFAFTAPEPGKYMLVGQRNGFRRQGYEQHGGFFSAVVVGPGLASENLVFRLRTDAHIVGTIVDEESEPVTNAAIYLFRVDATGGFRQTFLAAQTGPDDLGRYRFSHLESGEYYLAVSAQPWFSSHAMGTRSQSLAERALVDMAFPMTFYPAATDSASSSPIVLSVGQEFTADFRLTAVPAVRIRLPRFNPDPAQPRNATLNQRVFGLTINLLGQRPTPVEESLEIRGVPPGKYVLDVASYSVAPFTRLTRSTVIEVTSDMDFDADAISIIPTIRGVVRREGGLNLQPQAFVRLWNSRTHDLLDAMINPDGQFSFDPDSLVPGNYSVFVVSGLNSIIGSLSATGAQVTGQSIQITGAKPIQLDIALCPNLSTINGTARRNGQPFPGAMIVLVPENPEVNLPLFRRDQSDSDGTFTLRDVLPGRYKIVAIENGWDLQWANPAFLKPRLAHAESAEVQPNKTYQVQVNVE